MEKTDYLVEDNFDLKIQEGDFAKGTANDIHSRLIMYIGKGELRQFPTLGAAITKYIGSNTPTDIIENDIINELAKDNIDVLEIDVEHESSRLDIKLKVE